MSGKEKILKTARKKKIHVQNKYFKNPADLSTETMQTSKL